jgi:hypothetical protein
MALDDELRTFETHRSEWLQHHRGKFALIKGTEVAEFFDSAERAFAEGIERWGNVSFLIKQIVESERPECLPALMFGLIDAHS